MIKRVIIKKFKRLNDVTVDLHPQALSLVVGGNNSGKTTLLHAIAVWQYSWTIIRFEKGEIALLNGARADGLGVSLDDFTPLNIPSFKYLWTNLKPGSSYTLTIDCYWDLAGVEKHLCIGLAYAQDRLYVKNVRSNLIAGDRIPNSPLPGDRYVASTGKRLGEEPFFSGAFVCFSSHFCYFSFVLFGGNGIFCKFACERVVILSSIPDK